MLHRQVLAVLSGLIVLTGGEVGLFLWLNEAEIAARRADALFRRQAYAAAVELYQQALRRHPGRPDLLLPLAKALGGSGRPAEARLAVGQVLAVAPRDVQAHQVALELAWQAKDRPGVIDAATALLAIDPRHSVARRDLARALAAVGRSEEAETEYRRLIEGVPSEVSAMVELGVLLEARGDRAGAVEQRRRALAASAGDLDVQLGLADLLAASGRFAEAADLYQRHLARRPGDRSVRLRLAETLNALKAFDRSAAEYRVVLEQSPDDAETRVKLARALSWSKRYEESIEEYRRVLGER